MARRRRKNRKYVIGGLILVLLVVIGVVGVLVWQNKLEGGTSDANSDEVKEIVEATKDTDADTKNEKSEDEMEEDMMREKNVVQYEGNNPNKAEALSGVITYAGVNGGNLMIRANIDQYLGSGTCELILIRDGAVIYNSTASIVASASTATCEGFDVPVSEVGNGNVEINIKLSTDGRSGLIRGEANI